MDPTKPLISPDIDVASKTPKGSSISVVQIGSPLQAHSMAVFIPLYITLPRRPQVIQGIDLED
jgi:hypothetical protein